MHGVLISAFDTCYPRVQMLKEYYESKGHEVTFIASNFSHVKKSESSVEGADILINVRKYLKNLSIDRLRSHYGFAQDCLKEVRKLQPDFIHCLIPPNALTKAMATYKKECPNTKLFFDVIDVWPETMPINHFKTYWPFSIWKNQRDGFIKYADVVFTECELFQSVLPQMNSNKVKTLFWAREEKPLDLYTQLKENEIHFCYLGAINNIIDIDRISSFLSNCQKYKPTVLHIIGHGESKDLLIQSVESQGVQVIDHGSLYQQDQKQKVFDQCHYALNIMKESVVVGLSMKSLDYMCGQVPLINTIGGDTNELCQHYNIGYNLNEENLDALAKQVCEETIEENLKKRECIKNIYLRYFTKESFFETLDSIDMFD